MSFRSPKGFTVYETYKNDFVALILSDQFRSNNNIEQMNKPCKNRERNTCQNCKGGKFLKKL